MQEVLTTEQLTQMVECRTSAREVLSSRPRPDHTHGRNITDGGMTHRLIVKSRARSFIAMFKCSEILTLLELLLNPRENDKVITIIIVIPFHSIKGFLAPSPLRYNPSTTFQSAVEHLLKACNSTGPQV